MKKLLLIPALMLASTTMTFASQKSKYEISPMVGYNIAEGNIHMKDDGYAVYGLELQSNSADSHLSPELSFLYSNAVKYEKGYNDMGKTDMLRIALNAVYTFDKLGTVVPFAKLGGGYENVSTEIKENNSDFFLDAGAGLKVPFNDSIALKLEAIYMLKDLGNRYDNNLALMAGITFAFGETAQKAAPAAPVAVAAVAAPIVVMLDDDQDGIENKQDKCPNTPIGTNVDYDGCAISLDGDKDGVLDSEDKCPTTPTGKAVDVNGCCLDLDGDKDGVLDSKDICPNTPLGDAVNSDGCSKSINLFVNFENNSYAVDSASEVRIQKYADFLSTYKNYSAKIVGYTDSRGSAKYNQKLSQNRANAVKNLLIKKGAPAKSVTSAGKGEASPIADNKTSKGRAENRRIEAELTKH